MLPGLINAHDHLELNHYGPLKRRDRYENATGVDRRPAAGAPGRSGDPRSAVASAAARLFIGALKNLLAGVTTVAHHNPLYREIGRAFPVRVLRRYGWAHSFTLEHQPVGARGEPGGDVRERCLATPPTCRSWCTLARASTGPPPKSCRASRRSDACGRTPCSCTAWRSRRPSGSASLTRGASLVWCPASNAFLFGSTAAVRDLLDAHEQAWRHVCLGSDSRVTGSRDLLDELRAAARFGVSSGELLRMVTDAPARILNLPDAGRIAVGVPADLVVLPSEQATHADALLRASRRDLTLVAIAGRPIVGCPSLSAVFVARRTTAQPVAIDGVERLVSCDLAHAIARCPDQPSRAWSACRDACPAGGDVRGVRDIERREDGDLVRDIAGHRARRRRRGVRPVDALHGMGGDADDAVRSRVRRAADAGRRAGQFGDRPRRRGGVRDPAGTC